MRLKDSFPAAGSALPALLLFVPASLASCGPRVGTAPPSAASPVETSVTGLAALFEVECIQQIDRAWVDKRSQDILDTCPSGDYGDCTTELDGDLNWAVPTKDHSNIFISMAWAQKFDGPTPGSGPPAGPLRCSLYVKDVSSSTLERVAEQFKIGGESLVGPLKEINPGSEIDLIWRSKNNRGQMILRHHIRTKLLNREPNFHPYSHSAVDEIKYPWELIYIPRSPRS
jgi:hypothetical protein